MNKEEFIDSNMKLSKEDIIYNYYEVEEKLIEKLGIEHENYKLQEENQELKKQKNDVVEYIKYQLSNLDFKKEEDMKAKMLGSMILVMLEDKEC